MVLGYQFPSIARALRVEYPDARYHIMCRGNKSRDIFQSQEDADRGPLAVSLSGSMGWGSQRVVHGAFQNGESGDAILR